MLVILFPDALWNKIQMHGEQIYSHSTYKTAKTEQSALQSLKKTLYMNAYQNKQGKTQWDTTLHLELKANK